MRTSNWLDNAIGFFSPREKARRLYSKLVSHDIEKQLGRRYEGAAHGRRTAGWMAPGTSANAEIAPALATLRNRSRDLVRNNGYAKRGISVIRTNVVGRGIVTQVKAKSNSKAEKLDAVWKEWALETWCDYDGLHDINGLQNLVIGAVAESGECLIRLRRAHSEDLKSGLPIPIQLQVLEGDFLDTAGFSKAIGENQIIQGIEFDPLGRRVAYHLYETHPGDFSIIGAKYGTIRVPANEILHIYNVSRPGQIRGIPWLAAAILKMRDLDDYEDAQLVRQKIAACFTAFVHDAELPENYTAGNDRGLLGEKVEPGMIELLPPGKEVTFGNPPVLQGYKEYTATQLQAIASALGITYEALTGDMSQVNFSSGRMGWIEMNRNINDWQQRLMIGQMMKPLFWWFTQGCELVGYDSVGVKPEFTPPKREMIDPTKEVPAMIEAIRSGLMTLPEAIKMNGRDPLTVFEEIRDTNKKIDSFDLILDSDPRKSGPKKQGAADDKNQNA